MKRKIAILLSAMMVATAMPMTASAVQLKSDSVVNAGFGKVNHAIDINAENKTEGYSANPTTDQLRNRQSVLKVVLDNDGTGNIEKNQGRFKITLTNGTFGDLTSGDANDSVFGYKNTLKPGAVLPTTLTKVGDDLIAAKTSKDGKAVSYLSDSTDNKGTADKTTDGIIVELSSLKGVYKIENAKVSGMYADDGTFVPVENLDAELVAAIDNVIPAIAACSGNASSGKDQIKSGAASEMSTMLKASTTVGSGSGSAGDAIKAVADRLNVLYSAAPIADQPILPQIPYDITIDSETEATITPKQDIPTSWLDSNADGTVIKSLDTKTANVITKDNLSMEVYVDDTAGKVKIAKGDTVPNVGKDSGGVTGYIKLCPSADNEATTVNLLKVGTVAEIAKDKPYMAIPLGGVKVSGDGAVKAKVSSDYDTRVKGGEYTITKGTGEGSTSLVYPTSSVKSFDESIVLDPVVIRENVRQTIANGASTAKFTLKVNGGFKFINATNGSGNVVTDTNSTKFDLKDASGANTNVTATAKYVGDGYNTIEVTVTGLSNRTNPIGLSISGLKIAPVNTRTFGDVELTVSGDNIDSKTVKVATRAAVGFKLETVKEPKEIVVGRTYENDNVNMSEQDNQTVEVKFSEAVAGSLIASRSLDFNMPEGVKIVNADISEARNITGNSSSDSFNDSDFEIINNGKTLRLKSNGYKVNSNNGKNLGSFKIKFELSVDPSFTGDIKCNVTGGGQASDVKVETVVAKAVAPFKVEAKNTKINLGYQDYNTADIVITESKPGMFLQNKNVEIGLKAPFKGGQTIGFSEAQFEVSGGELEVKSGDFKVNDKDNGKITFKINRSSTKNPSTVTIKNVKIGTNRSVPFGSYSLTLGGNAVINNYVDTNARVDADGKLTTTNGSGTYAAVSNEDSTIQLNTLASKPYEVKQLANQDRTEYFEIKDYVNVVTETGTFNETVKVTVGEKTVVVGGQTLDMDVAPYIQASSNSTMVPLRFVAVALGVDSANVANPDQSSKVAWDQNTKTVTIYYGAGTGQKIIQFQAGSNIMTVDGTRIPMEYGVKAEIKEGRMFVPFRALGQALGVSVTWDQNTKTAIYNENNARNANVTTTATETTTASTTATTTTTTESTTKKEDSTTSTTKAESSTETTTKANK